MSISGKHIAFKIGNTTPVLVPGVQSWAAVDEAQELDGTTAEDQGFANPDDGLASLTIDAQLVIDITAGDLTTIQRGTLLTYAKFYADIGATAPIYTLPLAKVFRSTPRGEINGRFTYDVTIKSKGAYILGDPN